MRRSLKLLHAAMFKRRGLNWSPAYRKAMWSALVQQLLILGFTSMILDGGVLCGICFNAAVGFWTGFVIIWIRRPIPTAVDLAVIKVGYLLLCLIAFVCAAISH
jgi:hypothetical protein